MASSKSKTYAVLFRTHFWDVFAQKQLERLCSEIKEGDVYVLVDESNGPVSGIHHDKIFGVNSKKILEEGFADAGEGSLLWFNGDYPLYSFRAAHPEYQYYIQTEYDVILNLDIDDWVTKLSEKATDFVGLTKGEPTEEWFWLNSCKDCYTLDQIRHQLICVSVFSARALDLLRVRRLEMSELLRTGAIRQWPMCEAFIPTELAIAGFRIEELSRYGRTESYDHWPPFLENDAVGMADVEFIHPVLDQDRYVASVMKYHVGIEGYLNPFSGMHRRLRRLPFGLYLRILSETFVSKVKRNMKLRTIRHVVRRESF